jgi:hypothetical protein
MGTGRAGSCHGGDAAKARWTGERRGKHTRHGVLGCSIHRRRSNHRGLEEDMALAGGVAGWEERFTGGAQITGDWRTALRATRTWRVGSSHTQTTAEAAWFGGGG